MSKSARYHRRFTLNPVHVLACWLAMLLGCPCITTAQQSPPARSAEKPAAENTEKPNDADAKSSEASKRTELNLLGKTDTASGESRRNENVQFNLVDNNAHRSAG